jgi:PIN domain nuclease of toxin-antitoxin system
MPEATSLIDTQSMLWFITDHPKLSRIARLAIDDPESLVFVSHASASEFGIKYNKRNLPLPEPPEPYLARHIETNGFHWVPITLPTIYRAAALPRHHDDPFDRLIVAQSLRDPPRRVPLISSDKDLDAYGIRRVW